MYLYKIRILRIVADYLVAESVDVVLIAKNKEEAIEKAKTEYPFASKYLMIERSDSDCIIAV